MRIWYIARFDIPREVECEKYTTKALRDLGHEVVCTEAKSNPDPNLRVKDFDMVLLSKDPPIYLKSLLQECKSCNIPSVCWNWDLYFGYRKRKPPETFKADYVFSTDGGHEKEYRESGINHYVLYSAIDKSECQIFPCPQGTPYDIGFVGGLNPIYHLGRVKLGEELRKRFGDRFLHITGKYGLELNKELAKVKVIVGDSYPSPYYWSNRIYEVMGRGGFLLYPETPGLEKEFKVSPYLDSNSSIEIATFERGNFDALEHVIYYYLGSTERRIAIRDRGFEKVRENYTYEDRCSQMLEVVFGSDVPSRKIQRSEV